MSAEALTTSSTPEPTTAVEQQTPPQIEQDAGRKVFIGNLSYNATEEEVKEFIAPAGGSVEKLELAARWNGRAAGYAFAVWSTTEEANAAVEKLNKQTLGDREISVAVARTQAEKKERRPKKSSKKAAAVDGAETVQEGAEPKEGEEPATGEAQTKPKKKRNNKKKTARRIPEEAEEADAGEAVEQADGQAEEKAAKPKRTRNKKPKAVVEGEEGTQAAPRIDDEESSPAESKPKAERKPRQPRTMATGEPSSTLLFVANLPFTVDDAALADIFSKLDITISSAKVITKPGYRRKGAETVSAPRSKGFGFVETSGPEQQKAAVEKLQGYTIGEREIVVKIANERQAIVEEEGVKSEEKGEEAPVKDEEGVKVESS